MKKRIFAALLTLVMMLSLLPMNALAATSDPETDGGDMTFTKTAAGPDNDGNYTITMTAQAKGQTTTTTTTAPMDIVLVLDQSGSMDDKFDQGTRQNAMKAAVKGFIDTVAAKSQDSKISIVKFAGTASDTVGNTTYKEDGYSYNHSQIVVPLTAVDSAGVKALKDAVSGLKAGGATRVDLGMKKAAKALEASTNARKVVIVFTDGVPTTERNFDTGVANTAISTAKSMKDSGVTVYTVGIFNGANPTELYGKDKIGTLGSNEGECSGKKGDYWQYREGLFSGGDIQQADIAAGNRFLNYLSSNYEANKIGVSRYTIVHGVAYYIGFKITDDPAKGSNQGYYKTASNASSLNSIFKTITETITKPVKEALNGDTEITDTLSGYFTFASDVPANSVEVYAEKADGTKRTGAATATIIGKTVTVTNYDFSKHFKGSSDEETLVIKITVKPSGDGSTTADIPTNADDATTGPAAKVTLNDVVVASHETAIVTGHKVSYDLNGGEGTIPNNGQYYAEGTALTRTTVTPTKTNYTFGGWETTDDVTVDANNGFTMPNKDVTFTAKWERNPATPAQLDLTGYIVKQIDDMGDAFENDTTFTVNVVPKTGGAGINGTATLKAGSADFHFTDKLVISEDTTFYVREDNDNIAGVEYDDTTYLLKVTTGLDTETNAVTVASIFYSDDNGTTWHEIDGKDDGDKLVITNKYTKPARYNVVYDWGTSAPSDQTLPTNTNFYASEAEARAAMDTTFNRGYTSTAKNGEQEGTWTFSGWDNGELSGITITFTGSWTFTPEEIEPTCVDVTINYYQDDLTGDPIGTGTTNAEVGSKITLNDTQLNAYKPDGYNNGVQQEPKPYPVQEENNVINVLYTKAPVPETVTIDLSDYFQKDLTVTGDYPYSGGSYTIALKENVVAVNSTDAEQSEPAADAYDATATATYAAGEYGVKSFAGELTLKVGSHDYRVWELNPNNETGYDSSEYWINFYVSRLDNGSLTVTASKPADGNEWMPMGDDDHIVFRNSVFTGYRYIPTDPTPSKPALNTDDHYAYVVGYPDGTVRPNGSITRAEAATIFFRLLTDATRSQYWTTTNAYSDVAAGSWYNNAISTMSSAGIVNGYPDGTFRPDAPITRAEMAKMISLFAKLDKTEDRFTDIAGHWAEAYIKLAAGNGWIEGYPDGSFKPQQSITRAETMTMINRVLERVPSTISHLLPYSVMQTYPDCVASDWFYIAVQEATNSHTYERAATEKNGDEQWIALRDNRDWTQLEY